VWQVGSSIHSVKRFFNKLLGDRGEREATKYLKSLGYRIIHRQMHNQFGEIDIIANDNGQIVFVEVKTRTTNDKGRPEEAVDASKQRKINRVALAWLKQNRRLDQSARFDVVSIVWPEESGKPDIRHFINAFEATS